MSSKELQKIMIINKSKQLAFNLKFKSFSLSLFTWGLWGYILLFIYHYYEDILFFPLIENYFFVEIVQSMFILVGGLLVLTLTWSKISVPKTNIENA